MLSHTPIRPVWNGQCRTVKTNTIFDNIYFKRQLLNCYKRFILSDIQKTWYFMYDTKTTCFLEYQMCPYTWLHDGRKKPFKKNDKWTIAWYDLFMAHTKQSWNVFRRKSRQGKIFFVLINSFFKRVVSTFTYLL